MFQQLVQYSCRPHTTFTFDLKRVVKLAIAMDDSKVRSIEPTAFIFHESRCGSTLVANVLTAMDPEEHRVYSEAKPLITAIKACGVKGEYFTAFRATELLRDVIYMMGWTNDPKEKRLFFKMQSSVIKYIDVVMQAFPDTPWIFLYRDPVQVLMSQLDYGQHAANCVRRMNEVPQSVLRGRELKPIEKCALHLSILCEAAKVAIDHSHGMGIGVNYENLLNKLIDRVIPHHFNIPMTEERRQRIIVVGSLYSKGNRWRKDREWEEDSEKKDELASTDVRKACEDFLYGSYYNLKNEEVNDLASLQNKKKSKETLLSEI